MEKNILRLVLLVALLSLSCSKAPLLHVLAGNSRYSKGDYAAATVDYMKALDRGEYKEWIHYDIGNTYSSLGEIAPAIVQFKEALAANDEELSYRTNFNLGELHYELGDFAEAVFYFKEAVLANSSDVDAKINLELAIKKYENSQELSEQAEATGETGPLSEEQTKVLEAIQAEEEAVWKTITTQDTTPQAEDW